MQPDVASQIKRVKLLDRSARNLTALYGAHVQSGSYPNDITKKQYVVYEWFLTNH